MTNSNEYMATYMLWRYHERRAKAITFLGGVCVECGRENGLQLDHVDPKTKSIDIGKMWSVSEDRFWAEVGKCQLLCESHHILKSTLERGQTPARGTHGTLSSYRYCKCPKCREANRLYAVEYRKKKTQDLPI